MINVVPSEIVICGAARTPVGRFDGKLKEFLATDLGSIVIAGLIERAGVDPAKVDLLVLGNVVHAGLGMAGVKAAGVKAGLRENVCARGVDSVCGSGLDAIILAVESLLAGSCRVAIAGGMESRSTAPYLLGPHFIRPVGDFAKGQRPRMKRAGAYRWAIDGDEAEQLKGLEIKDATTYDGLFWVPERKFMREYALAFAKKEGYYAALINKYAASSHAKARQATEKGWFREEIVPCGEVETDELLSEDAQQRILTESPDDLASAYNSSVPADAAAVVMVTRGSVAAELGLQPIARVLAYARVDCAASDFLVAPVEAENLIAAALSDAGKACEFEIIEANEAFACQLPYFEKHFKETPLNVHGGAVALGHPLGAAGARLLTTLLFAMIRYGKSVGLVTLCFGGGGAVAMAVQRI